MTSGTLGLYIINERQVLFIKSLNNTSTVNDNFCSEQNVSKKLKYGYCSILSITDINCATSMDTALFSSITDIINCFVTSI